MLLGAVFLANPTYLMSETVAWSRTAWPLATLACIALTAGKLLLVAKGAKGLRVDASVLGLPRLVFPLV